MPKTAKHLWPAVVSFDNLVSAWHQARRGKRYAADVLRFYGKLGENLFNLQKQLLGHTWTPAPCRLFTVREPKLRLIQAPYFGDRVVHHALMDVVSPVFERRFIHDSYACRDNKGTHAASRRTTEFLRQATAAWERPWVLKADISKYFQSINHDLLLQRVRRVVSDPDVLWLFERVIRHGGYDECGLPIGALTSQWLANLYLDGLDHFVKDDMGVRFYLRYMDDFVLIGPSGDWCRTALGQITRFLTCQRLTLNPKTGIWPASRGIDFVGYRHWPGHTLPRKRTVKRARRQFKSLALRYRRGDIELDYVRPRVVSFTGYMAHCNGYRSLEAILREFVLVRPGAGAPIPLRCLRPEKKE